MTVHARFPSPYDLKAPAGAEGWQQLYPYYLRFQDELREYLRTEGTAYKEIRESGDLSISAGRITFRGTIRRMLPQAHSVKRHSPITAWLEPRRNVRSTKRWAHRWGCRWRRRRHALSKW